MREKTFRTTPLRARSAATGKTTMQEQCWKKTAGDLMRRMVKERQAGRKCEKEKEKGMCRCQRLNLRRVGQGEEIGSP